MVGHAQWVADQILAAGIDPDQHAFMSVQVTPRYDRIGGSESTYVAKLNVGEPNLSIDQRIEASIQQKLRTEARELLSDLSGWSRPLDERETQLLLAHPGQVNVEVPEPFYGIETWTHRPLTVTLVMQPLRGPSPIVRYIDILPDGTREVLHELRVNRQFWVEAQFSEPPAQQYQQAEVAWPGGSVMVPLQRTDRLLFYRGGPFYIVPPADAASEPAEAATAPTGEPVPAEQR
jgi:hypothetical protein